LAITVIRARESTADIASILDRTTPQCRPDRAKVPSRGQLWPAGFSPSQLVGPVDRRFEACGSIVTGDGLLTSDAAGSSLTVFPRRSLHLVEQAGDLLENRA
jgi:hypothetical protein